MSSSALPPMGWYSDPGGSSQERYWDGVRWTPNLRDAPESAPGTSKPPREHVNRGVESVPGGPGPARPAAGVAGHPQPVREGRQASTTADGVPLAGWWWRVLGTLIDQTVIVALAILPAWGWIQQLRVGFAQVFTEAMVAAQSGRPAPGPAAYSHLNTPMLFVQLTVIGVGAGFLLISYLAWGRTLGNMATGTWVVRVDRGTERGRLSPALALGRTLAITAILLLNQILPVLWLIDALAALVTRRRQTLHDLLAGTQVVRPSATLWRG